MDIKIYADGVQVSEQLNEFTRRKLDKLDRYLPNIADVRVEINRQSIRRGGHQTSAQITLRHSRGAILRSEERLLGENGDDVKAVITKATEKLYRQIERFKGKRRDRRRTRIDKFERYYATEEELETAEEIPEFEEPPTESLIREEEEQEILRRKEIELMPMFEQEAVEQMELLGHNFFMFMNGDTGQVNVLYRRDAGGYGVLIPRR